MWVIPQKKNTVSAARCSFFMQMWSLRRGEGTGAQGAEREAGCGHRRSLLPDTEHIIFGGPQPVRIWGKCAYTSSRDSCGI